MAAGRLYNCRGPVVIIRFQLSQNVIEPGPLVWKSTMKQRAPTEPTALFQAVERATEGKYVTFVCKAEPAQGDRLTTFSNISFPFD